MSQTLVQESDTGGLSDSTTKHNGGLQRPQCMTGANVIFKQSDRRGACGWVNGGRFHTVQTHPGPHTQRVGGWWLQSSRRRRSAGYCWLPGMHGAEVLLKTASIVDGVTTGLLGYQYGF